MKYLKKVKLDPLIKSFKLLVLEELLLIKAK